MSQLSAENGVIRLAFGDDHNGIAMSRVSLSEAADVWTEYVTTDRVHWDALGPVDATHPVSLVAHGGIALLTDTVGNDATVLRSADGGRTWIRHDFHVQATYTWAIAAGSGFVVGTDGSSNTLEVSRDGGLTWTEVVPPFGGLGIGRMACRPSGRCVAADAGALWHADSFGTKWSSGPSAAPLHDAQLFYADDGTLFAIDRLSGTSGTDQFLSSTDDGRTWNQIGWP